MGSRRLYSKLKLRNLQDCIHGNIHDIDLIELFQCKLSQRHLGTVALFVKLVDTIRQSAYTFI